MSKKKYYAVRVGKAPGIYCTWGECKIQIEGVSGAVYKAFSSLEEAESFVTKSFLNESEIDLISQDVSEKEINLQVEKDIENLEEDELIAFVDGSYNEEQKKSAFGALIFSYGGNKDILYKAFTKDLGEDFISTRNVGAELEAVKETLNWATKYHKKNVTIYYDYSGIEKWASGQWKAKTEIAKKYVNFIDEKRRVIQIEFAKVPAHSGVKFNEEVDNIAKKALLAKGYKTYNDGSVYFVGYGVKEWDTIISCVKEENSSLDENGEILSIDCEKKDIGKRVKIKVSQGTSKVTINCYGNSRSFVQGKQTSLFQKIISIAIEFLEDKQTVIETLNSYHALTIKQHEVENKFDELLPNYNDESPKLYANLLSAVYNTMLIGYMPDYTCLVTPLFRAYEYYLHRILHDVMKLDTETQNGTNNFSFFSKNSSGLYECNNSNRHVLSSNQLTYLNNLYTKYNNVRHPYSHWSQSELETAVITNIEEARNILNEGISLINEYYNLFK